MRRQSNVRRPAVQRDYVSGAVDGGFPAIPPELLQKPGRALLFQKGGRRHAAKLQVDFVHPLLLARKPLQALAHPTVVRDVAHLDRRRRAVGSHSS